MMIIQLEVAFRLNSTPQTFRRGGDKVKIEIRSSNEAFISGYVNAVERESRILPKSGGIIRQFVEKVRAGTFRNALETEKPVELRFNHDRFLCDTESGLTLHEDNIGLYAEATITDTEVIQCAKNGELRGWSFGFVCKKDSWDKDGELDRRTLEDIELKEVSILTKTPAYIGTSVEVRSNEVTERRGFEGVAVKSIECEIEQKKQKAKMLDREIEILRLRGKC